MKVFSGGLFFVAIVTFMFVVGVKKVSAQATDDDCNAGYEKFLANRNGPELDKYKLALTTGKDYISKCGELEGRGETKNFVAKLIPKIDEKVRITELENRFQLAVPAKDWADAIASGKELIAANHPATLDIMITLAGIGYTKAALASSDDGNSSDAITQAKNVINRLNSGATSENFGTYQFRYKTKACADGKMNTISWMNYSIGYVTYNRQKQPKEAIPFLLKASQDGCELKDFPEIYRMIGAWYAEDAVKLEAVRVAKIKAADGQETDESKAAEALFNGYTDRAINAYARAVKFAKDRTDITQAYKDALYKRLQGLIESRYDGEHETADQFVAKVMDKPFPDPMTTVTPVVDPAPATPVTPQTPPVSKPPAKKPTF